jgi:transposase
MRGEDQKNPPSFVMMDLESMVPSDHPLREIHALTEQALTGIQRDLEALYSDVGRPSIPPEMLLRALLLQLLYSIRSERLLMEQIQYNMLFRWFVGLGPQDPVWNASTFSKNRQRFLDGELAQRFLEETVRLAKKRSLLSDEHFSVDGTLIEAWASLKSLHPREEEQTRKPPDDPGNPSVDFRGEKRRNDTHRSTTDTESRIVRKGKGKEARLGYTGVVLMENRNGLVVEAELRIAEADPEREGTIGLLKKWQNGRKQRITAGGDKWFDEADFIRECRKIWVTPHVAVKEKAGSGLVDGRTLRHSGYIISQRIRKRIEEVFGWLKEPGRLKRTKHRGVARAGWMYVFGLAIYNLIRMRNIAMYAVV